jgi:transcription elongation GreA/GreB family factor
MKKVLGVILMSGFFTIGLLVSPYAFAQSGELVVKTKGTTVAVAANEPVVQKDQRHERERHPEIERAINKLREAKHDLEKAAHDYGGHRVAAIGAIDRAIGDLEAALHYDRR